MILLERAMGICRVPLNRPERLRGWSKGDSGRAGSSSEEMYTLVQIMVGFDRKPTSHVVAPHGSAARPVGERVAQSTLRPAWSLPGIPEPRVALEDSFSRLFWNASCFQAVQIH